MNKLVESQFVVEESLDIPTIELRNGYRLALRAAVSRFLFLKGRQERHPGEFAVLVAIYEGRQPPPGRDLVELQQAGIIKRDGSLDPEYWGVLDASIQAGPPTTTPIGPPYRPADQERWVAEENRFKLDILALLRSTAQETRPARPR